MKTIPNAQKKQNTGRSVPVTSVSTPKVGVTKLKKDTKPGFISLRSLLLSLLLFGFLGVVRQVKSYDNFFKETIDASFEKIAEIREVNNYKSVETRKQMRWGYSYYWLIKTAEFLKKQGPGAIVLVPPNDYIKTINGGQTLPEPAIAYYYSGVKTAWGNTDYAYKCTHFYNPNKKSGPGIIPIRNRAHLDSLLQLYKGYTYSY